MSNLLQAKVPDELVTASPTGIVQHSETQIEISERKNPIYRGLHMSLALAELISNGVINYSFAKNIAITVVVVDASNHQIVSKRMDGCPPTGMPQFALAKASTCISMNMSSRAFRDRYTSCADPSQYCQMLSMVNITGGNMAPFPGGVLIRRKDTGTVVGAVGVSGGPTSDIDEECAIMGVRASGLLRYEGEDGWVTEPSSQ